MAELEQLGPLGFDATNWCCSGNGKKRVGEIIFAMARFPFDTEKKRVSNLDL